MRLLTKQQLLEIAEVIDAFRVFPRIFLTIYIVYLWDVHRGVPLDKYEEWYAALVWGGLCAVSKWYVDSGRDWSK